MKKQLRNSIRKAYNKLTEEEKQTLRLISVLCTGTDGITLRCLCDVVMEAEPHVFEKEVIALAKAGLLVVRLNTVFCPTEITTALNDAPASTTKLTACISKLSISLKDCDLRMKPYFVMAMTTMKYVLANSANDGVDFQEFGRLVVNITRHYELFGEPDMSIHDVHDLPLWCGLNLAKSKTDNKSILYARLCMSQANLLLNGFWYEESRLLLDEALSIAHDDKETLASVYFTKALWHENFGQIGDCLACAYQSWEVAEDDALKDSIALYIAFQLALLEEFESSQQWMEKVDVDKYPQYCTQRVFSDMVLALKNSGDESLCEDYLRHAEWSLDRINVNAPLKGRIYYVWSQICSNWTLHREANNYYRMYSELMAEQYKSTDGAAYIYIAAEVNRLTSIGALVAARHVINDQLDSLQLMHPGYSLSVKVNACLSYINNYRTSGLQPLDETYYRVGLEFAKQTIPSKETINIIRNIFNGGYVPERVSGSASLWLFEHQHLLNMIENHDYSRPEIHQQIDLITERFPAHKNELDVIAASLLHSDTAVHQWHLCLTHAETEQRYSTALMCARQAVAEDLIYDALDFYDIALHNRKYKESSKFEQISVLLEAVINMEQCGLRGRTHEYWRQLEDVADGTPLIADVYQARANSEYNRENYSEALHYYDMFLKVYVYEAENSLIDERLMSVFSFLACSYNALHDYQHAYEASKQAIRFFPESELAFNIHYNFVYLCLALGKKSEARIGFETVRQLARTEEEKTSVKQVFELIKMTKKQRQAYFQSEEQNEVY